MCMKYFAEIQGSAHKLNGLLPALRKVDYDLRPGFKRYTHWQGIEPTDNGNSLIPWVGQAKSLAVTLSCFFY